MRIASTQQLQLSASYQRESRTEEHEMLTASFGGEGEPAVQISYQRHRLDETREGAALAASVGAAAEREWDPDALARMAKQARQLGAQQAQAAAGQRTAPALPGLPAAGATASATATADEPAKPQDRDALEVALLVAVVEELTGRKLGLPQIAELELADPAAAAATPVLAAPPSPAAAAPADAPTAPAPFSLSYQYSYSYSESEQSSYSASARFSTEDGRDIALNLSFSMSRSYSASEQITLRAGTALKDPLVLSFSGTAGLSAGSFGFDIDADGSTDQIHGLDANSAFLALDLNGNRSIDDGRELFGALSGDGFADLAAYDGDANGFIDENDQIFSALRLWQSDAQGVQNLRSLKDAGIGAIALASIGTPFDLHAGGELAGKVRASGFYLNENGSAGALQQVDLVA